MAENLIESSQDGTLRLWKKELQNTKQRHINSESQDNVEGKPKRQKVEPELKSWVLV